MSRFCWFKNYNRNKFVFTLWVKLKTLADSVDLAGFESCSRNKSALSVKSAREKIEILADWTDFADLKIIIEINLFSHYELNKKLLQIQQILKVVVEINLLYQQNQREISLKSKLI